MLKAIVYTSNSGFTKHYAELLSKETGLAAYELDESKKKIDTGAEVIYMGWLMAGMIKGYKKAVKRYKVKAVCAVGMTQPKDGLTADTKTKNNITNAEVFYLQGGLDMDRVHGIYKLMMKTMSKLIGGKLEAKTDKTQEDLETLEMLKKRVDKVSVENLSDVVKWYRKA